MVQAPLPGSIDYNAIYISVWQGVKDRCHQRLEPDDYALALQISSTQEFREKLADLQTKVHDSASRYVLALLYPAIDHYEAFAHAFVNMMEGNVDVSLMWGLLYLLLKLSLGSQRSLGRISAMLHDIGAKIHLLQGYVAFLPLTPSVTVDALHVNQEVVLLWLNLICMFRDPIHVLETEIAWDTFRSYVKNAEENIDKAVTRAEKDHALKTAEVTRQHEEQIRMYQKFLESSAKPSDDSKSFTKLNNIPFPVNHKFFGREKILADIDLTLKPSDKQSQFSSVVLWGIGGVGKSQIVLHYAYNQAKLVDLVLWIPSENEEVLMQTYSRIAKDILKFEDTDLKNHVENRVRVLTWLREADKTWLLIFDNVESTNTLVAHWPISSSGAVIVTTRNPNMARHLVQKSIEVQAFQPDDDAEFFLSLLTGPRHDDMQHAVEVASTLGGHALALNQMAAFVMSRGMNLQDFLSVYQKSPEKMHRQRRDGAAAFGYDLTIGSVWKMSFDVCDGNSTRLLGVIAMVAPTRIPLSIFKPDSDSHPPGYEFCSDDFDFDDAVETLLNLSLVQKEIESGSLHIHRLIQAEFLHQSTAKDRQAYFASTVRLMLESMADRESRTLPYWEDFPKYIEHLRQLVQLYISYSKSKTPLEPSIEFCTLVGKVCWALNGIFQKDVVDDLLKVGLAVSEACGMETRDGSEIYSYLRNFAGRRCYQRGQYDESIKHFEIALHLRRDVSFQPRMMCNTHVNLGLVWASNGDLDLAMNTVNEGLELCDKYYDDQDAKWRDTKMILMWAEAGIRLDVDLLPAIFVHAKHIGSIPDTVSSHVVAARVYAHCDMHSEAHSHVEQALGLLNSQKKLSYYAEKAKCLWTQGSIYLRENKPDLAVPKLEESYTTMELCDIRDGPHALCLYRLSRAIEQTGGNSDAAEKYALQAQRELYGMQDRVFDPDQQWAVYEDFVKLVQVTWRL